MSFSLKKYTRKEINALTNKRDFETKIGEFLVDVDLADVVILGISESIGPKANLGKSGSENAFSAFLSCFMNMQYNRFSNSKSIALLGEVVCAVSDDLPILEYRNYVSRLDDFIYKILSNYLIGNQLLIVVGGGHNNTYPLLKYSYEHHGKINVLNLDPHADYRSLEGRHSGNGFSYAFHDGFILKYSVLGMHRNYNSEAILDALDKDGHYYSFFEDWITGERNLTSETEKVICEYMQFNNRIGLELDLDSIAFMPTSAFTPSGISVEGARKYISNVVATLPVAYVHLPEGAPQSPSEARVVGKTLAYLVMDAITNANKQNTNNERSKD
jgi:formiminoglutamase